MPNIQQFFYIYSYYTSSYVDFNQRSISILICENVYPQSVPTIHKDTVFQDKALVREISHKKNQVNINLVRPAVIAVKVKNFNHVLKTVHLEPIRLIVQEIILKI